MGLTLKQQRFADEYIICANAAQSAIKAGYSKKTAYQTGPENLRKPKIKEYIAKRLEALESEKIANQKEALETLTKVLRREETEQTVVTLRKPKTLKMTSANGKEYDKLVYEDVQEVVDVKPKLSDTVRAADLLIKLNKIKADAELSKARAKQAKIMNGDAEPTVHNDGPDDGGFLEALKRAGERVWGNDQNDNTDSNESTTNNSYSSAKVREANAKAVIAEQKAKELANDSNTTEQKIGTYLDKLTETLDETV